MDIQTEKLQLIEQLAKLEDIEIIEQIKYLLANPVVGTKPDGTPIRQSDLIKRAKKAQKDIKAGRIHSQQEVRNHFEKKFTNE